MYSFTYHFDRRGFGQLTLRNNEDPMKYWAARTGSIDTQGRLVNAIGSKRWKLLDEPEWTKENAMMLGGIGWKARLYTAAGESTHYLIHPDGGKGGTMGCIGLIGTVALPLKDLIERYVREQGQIIVETTGPGGVIACALSRFCINPCRKIPEARDA